MKHLRLRLTWLYTVTAGLILALAMTGFLMLRIHETKQEQLELFYSTWNMLSLRLQSDTILSQSFLAQLEVERQSVIHIEENGIPFLYQGSPNMLTNRQTLVECAKNYAAKQGIAGSSAPVSSSSITSDLFILRGDFQEQYYAMILVLAHRNGVRSLCLLMYIPPVWQSLKGTFFLLCGLEAVGILVLLLVSWHFVGWSLRPITENNRKQAEFIAAASHELRSPLAVLRSAIPAILTVPERKAALLHTMDLECSRMSRLIDDMLLLASADAKTWNIHPQKTDMDTLLIEIYEAFLPVCHEKQISLYLDLPEEPIPCLWIDPERIRQVLSILLDNALFYTPAGKAISICAHLKNHSGYLVMQVNDQGCGIPKENLPYIFDRFYRADKARSGKEHFGLGLSIAKELVMLHGGNITVANNPDGGSSFSVTLPAQSSKAEYPQT